MLKHNATITAAALLAVGLHACEELDRLAALNAQAEDALDERSAVLLFDAAPACLAEWE